MVSIDEQSRLQRVKSAMPVDLDQLGYCLRQSGYLHRLAFVTLAKSKLDKNRMSKREAVFFDILVKTTSPRQFGFHRPFVRVVQHVAIIAALLVLDFEVLAENVVQ